MKKHFIISFMVFTLILPPAMSYAEDLGLFSGTLVDNQTGEPIEGASVLVYAIQIVTHAAKPQSNMPVQLRVEYKQELADIKLVQSDKNGKYQVKLNIPAINPSVILKSIHIVIYEPGYQVYTNEYYRILAASGYPVPPVGLMEKPRTANFPKQGNIVKFIRIPPRFDHRKHYEKIEQALSALAIDGKNVKDIAKANQFMQRAQWEMRRFTPDTGEMIRECCGGLNYLPGDLNSWPDNARNQYKNAAESYINKLDDKNPWERIDAVYTLGALRVRGSVELLLKVFRDDSDWRSKYVQQECVESLRKIAEPDAIGLGGNIQTVPLQPDKLEIQGTHNKPKVQAPRKAVIIGVLNNDVEKEVIPALLDKLNDPYLKLGIIKAFGPLRSKKTLAVLQTAMQENDSEIKAAAVTAYAYMADETILNAQVVGAVEGSGSIRVTEQDNTIKTASADPLIQALQSNDVGIQNTAIKALSNYRDSNILYNIAPFLSARLGSVAQETFFIIARNTAEGSANVCKEGITRKVYREGEARKLQGSNGQMDDLECGSRIVNPSAVKALLQEYSKTSDNGKMIILDMFERYEDSRIQELLLRNLEESQPIVCTKTLTLVPIFFGEDILPQVVKLTKSGDEKVRGAAFTALSHYQNPTLSDIFLAALDDHSPAVRLAAISFFRTNPNKNALPKLQAMTIDKDYGLASAAIYALGESGDSEAETPLIALVESGSKDNFPQHPQSKEKDAIVMLGKLKARAAVPALLNALALKRYEEAVIQTLGSIQDSRAIPVLSTYVLGTNVNYRTVAVQALSGMSDLSLLSMWQSYLEDKDIQRQSIGAQALGNIHDERAVDSLLTKLTSSYKVAPSWRQSTENQIIESLVKLKKQRTIRPLLIFTGTHCGNYALRVADVMRLNENARLPDMTGYLTDMDIRARKGAIYVLGSAGDRGHIRLLQQITEVKLYLDAQSAIDAIVRRYPKPQSNTKQKINIGNDSHSLIASAKSHDSKVRREAIRKISFLHNDSVTASLVPLLKDSDLNVRKDAVSELLSMHYPSAIEPLMEMMNNREENDTVRSFAAALLGAIHARQATDSLITVFDDETADMCLRKEAGVALGEIGDAKAIPALKNAIGKGFELDYAASYALGTMKVPY